MSSPRRTRCRHAPWTREELRVLARLRSPYDIQRHLDATPYSSESRYRSPRSVLRDRKAHCLDGALFAAAALRRLGHRPLIVDLRAVNDDDHVIALYSLGGHLGAVAKSNVVGLRFREPVHRSLRELVLTYFDPYYNLKRQKTLRSYSLPLDLATLDDLEWMTCDAGLDELVERLDERRHVELLTPAMVRRLEPLDERSYRAGLFGSLARGLYQPR